ncbi:MAG: STAS domain-containing protein [Bacteroidetes bacterium]|nr:STAS domain-containing protein [Bacteroidota bacterium]
MVTFNYNPDNKVFTVTFVGRMDTLAVQKISEIMQVNLPAKDEKYEEKIVFDLNEVDYISSSFIRICVNVAKQTKSGQFSIAHCQPFIKKTFKISGLDELLNVT